MTQRHDIDLEMIRKQQQTTLKNCDQTSHMYKQGDKVLLKKAWKTKFNQDAYIGPYVITAVRNNDTERARRGQVTDSFNIRNLIPYKEEVVVHHGTV